MKNIPYRPIIRWPGGKSRMLEHLLPRIPKHTCYCEPFAGGLALLLAKPPSKLEVVNDLNGDLVSLYRNAQYHLPALIAEMEFVLNSRKDLYDFMSQPGLTELQRAARWFVRNRISFGGGMTSFGVQRQSGGAAGSSRSNALERLNEFNRRMDRVVVENLSYDRCLKLYDAPATFFFIDPPYLNSKARNYAGWNQEQMANLRKVLDGLKGRWLLTVDDSPFNRRLFNGHRIQAITTRNGAVNHRLQPKAAFGELIVSAKT